ncbi:hypothetical protein D0860_04154 [Hortaea werneckii]|uniref:RNase III domain-containing protein n=1 Tax=Hortaea werneckii TaxID=91943 RepID=A0A3M7H8A0_HORWE|nr:hypothetical protein D0860_04154 [Hortaea werneckii]RMZ30398.1 hypothetical protein D0859_05500 [Hortaea werneckii]
MPNKLGRAISLIQDLSGYRFRDENILLDAIDTTGLRVQQSNQRLALLGDSILKFIILDDWYPTGTPKGAGNDHVSRIGSNANLAAAARLHGIEACVFTHPGHRGPVSQATLSTTVEAIIGAVYLDSENDLNAVRAFMKALGLTILGTGNVPAQECKTLTAALSSRALDSMLRFARYPLINARHATTSYRIRMRGHDIRMLAADNENTIHTCRRGCIP